MERHGILFFFAYSTTVAAQKELKEKLRIKHNLQGQVRIPEKSVSNCMKWYPKHVPTQQHIH